MIKRLLTGILMLFCSGFALAQSGPLHVLTYHDVTDEPGSDSMAVTTGALVEHFRWLRDNDFHPVSMDQVVAARNGGVAMPANPVLLSFDDGLKSMYTHVYPLLKLFNYPAVSSLVTDWVEGEKTVDYAGELRDRGSFVSWEQIREMQDSGLVEFASHSHDMHRGIIANPQDNTQPAAVALAYADGRYESEGEYTSRILSDLQTSSKIIASHTGRAPRVMTWPYGAHNKITVELARQSGMPWSLTLEPNFGNQPGSTVLHRHLINNNPGIREIALTLQRPPAPPLVRAAQVDLDYVYDPDPAQQERNLGVLVERIHQLQISHVFLQAFSDLDGDGGAEALYFPNRYLPMRSDLFNRAAWQLKTRAGVRVYAWMPILSFTGDVVDPAWRVLQAGQAGPSADAGAEPRLSPFNPDARTMISGIYEDLARHARFDGLHFHDDGRLNELEDASADGIKAYRDLYGEAPGLLTLKNNPEVARRWAGMKTLALLEFTDQLTAIVGNYQAGLKSSRNMFSPALSGAEGPRLLAQDYTRFLAHYDFVTVMAMPYLENLDTPGEAERYYRDLASQARAQGNDASRTIFQLQTVDWRNKRRVPSRELKETLRLLQSLGIRNLAYYPDDFLKNHPDQAQLREGISVAEYPARSRP